VLGPARAHARRFRGGELTPVGRRAAPVQAVVEEIFRLGAERAARSPEGDDIVVDLALGRDLDQEDLALAPIPDRLYPQARPLFVTRLEILVAGEAPLALHEAEAARVVIDEARYLQVLRVRQRAPQPLVAAGADGEAIGIVDRGAEVVGAVAVVGGEIEHAGQRR